MKNNETPATTTDAPVKDSLATDFPGHTLAEPVETTPVEKEKVEPKPIAYGVQITGANGAPDRFIACESRESARSLVRMIRESRSAFESVSDDLIVSPTHTASAEVIEAP